MTNVNPWLNSILSRWLEAPEIPRPQVDCGACSKRLTSQNPERWARWKCCTFQPFVPNFSLGKIVYEGGELPELGFDHSWQPLGLLPGLKFREAYTATPEEERGENLLCQFYQDRKCSIWSARPTECATHFCVETSPSLAVLAEKSYAAETGVAQLALFELGFSSEEISEQIDWLNGERVPSSQLTRVEAQDLYREIWQRVLNFSREQVREWL